MNPRHPEEFDNLLNQAISAYYSAEPAIGLEDKIWAALRNRRTDHLRPTWRLVPLLFTVAAACCIALMIIIPSPRRTALEHTSHRRSVDNPQPETARHASSLTAKTTKTVSPPSDLRSASAAITRPSGLTQLPKLSVFPSSSGIAPGERQLLALSRHVPSPLAPSTVVPITIAAVEFKTIQIPPISTQPAP